MKNSRFSIKEALVFGWQTWRQQWRFFLVFVLLYLLFNNAPDLFVKIVGFSGVNFSKTAGFGFKILSLIFSLLTSVGLIKVQLNFVDGFKGNQYEAFVDSWKYFFNFVLTELIFLLISIAGFILLFIPGLYLLLKYQFALYLVIDKGLSPLAALKTSARLTQGEKWHLLKYWTFVAFIILFFSPSYLYLQKSFLPANWWGVVSLYLYLYIFTLITVPFGLASVFIYRKLFNASEEIAS